jgi:5-methylcytosine-specific restriction endonuclease McrA
MAKRKFTCAQCGGEGERESGDYNRKIGAGKSLYCSRRCSYEAQTAKAEQRANERARACETCGSMFTPRQTQITSGQGRYCSQKCNAAFSEAGIRPDVIARAKTTMARLRAEGKINYRRGENSPCWKGGPKEAYRRALESGRAAEQLRRYRRNNPDKVREFTKRRAGRKLGRLPYGTIPKLRAAQGDKCAICRCKLKGAGHVDHIVPLARGGHHAPSNLQLLCAPCNLHKSDRDPIQHMQSLGRLL